MTTKVLFIDRDGTLIEEPHDNQVDALDKIRLVRGVIPALLAFRDYGDRVVMVTNQDGLGTDSFPQADFDICQQHIVDLLASQGIDFDEIFVCPHVDDDRCECRKPRAGLLTTYLAQTSLDMAASAVVGDRQADMQLAEKIGVRGCLIDPGGDYVKRWLPELGPVSGTYTCG